MTVNKLSLPAKENAVQLKINEIIDNLGGGGTATDVQINGTSITSNNVANIKTNSTYNATSNKIATMADVPSVDGALSSTSTNPVQNKVINSALSNKYDASNPNGYTSNVGTVTKVNNTSPDANGNVTLSIPAAQIQSDWNQTTTTAKDYIKNKPSLSTVATSGSYNDLTNKPTIPTVNNATLTIQKNGTTVKTFTANASSNVTCNITVPTKTSDITNDSGYITGISSSDVTTALGYTPYNSTNPSGYQANVIETVKVNGTAQTVTSKAVDISVPTKVSQLTNDSGYTTNTGTVTSVNNVSPVNGNVSLSIPTVPTNISAFNNDSGYITGINSSDVTTALGYTPESTSNKVTSISSSSTDSEYPSAKSVVELLKTIYPVGAIFIGTTATCPMSALFGTWTLVAEDRCLQGSSTNHSANTTVAAGLPNIEGSIYVRANCANFGSNKGAFTTNTLSGSSAKYPTFGSSNSAVQGAEFSATSSNTIYGSSSTVQPPAYVVNVWRRTA